MLCSMSRPKPKDVLTDFKVIPHLCEVTRRNEAEMKNLGSPESSVLLQEPRLSLGSEKEAITYDSYC